MDSWLEQVADVIEDKLASDADNFYGYEIWNEPVYTWDTSNGTFYELWKNTYELIREMDPDEMIVGPSEGYYDHDMMYAFLSYCVENDCVPDIICWHELSSNGDGSYVGDFAANYADYRAIEDTLGISDLPISINEYCDIDTPRRGCPGLFCLLHCKVRSAMRLTLRAFPGGGPRRRDVSAVCLRPTRARELAGGSISGMEI